MQLITVRFLLILIISVFAKVISDSTEPTRVRRELGQFGNMIKCTTELDALEFNGYGCYCGFGGCGTPIDHIDRCCQEHDLCYQKAVTKNQCPSSSFTYIVRYRYDYSGCGTIDADISCSLAQSYPWFKVNEVCAAEICGCDRTAALCFSRGYFNETYKNYDKSSCNK